MDTGAGQAEQVLVWVAFWTEQERWKQAAGLIWKKLA